MSKAGQITGCQCRAAHTMELTIGNDNAHDDDLEAKPKQIRSSKKKKIYARLNKTHPENESRYIATLTWYPTKVHANYETNFSIGCLKNALSR